MRRFLSLLGGVLLVGGLLSVPADFASSQLLYGGNGGHSGPPSINDGALVTVNPANGAVTVVGHPAGVARLSGIAFDAFDALYGATQPAGGFPPPPPPGVSTLIRINPNNGALLSTIGTITDGATGQGINIADLAVQPGTNALFGIRGPNDGLGGQGILYTINKATGVATALGNTGDFFGSIAFAPNGTLYMTSADLDFATGNQINIALKTLNPTNAATLSSIPLADFFGALGVRPTDGVIFAGNGDVGQLFTINPLTGAETFVGSTGNNFVGDLAFRAVPEPGTLALLLSAGACGSFLALRRPRRR